jgi:acyl-CoA thioesterase FadM
MLLTPAATYQTSVTLGAEPGAVAGLLEMAQRAAAEDRGTLIVVTQSIEFGPSIAAGDRLEVRSWVDRATRTLLFVQAELALPDGGAVVATGSGVYRIAS